MQATTAPTPIWQRRCAVTRRTQSRSSLLEALVSIVVLSFGLLGVAGLQASALKYSRDARNQAIAVNLAREMAEMIRSNITESAGGGGKYLYQMAAVTPATSPCLPAACANTGDLAQAQKNDWLTRVSQALPGAWAAICADETPYDKYGVPQWACSGSGNIIAIKLGWEREDHAGNVQAANVRPYVTLPVTPAGQQ